MIPLTATKTIEQTLDAQAARFTLTLGDLVTAARRAQGIARKLGVSSSDPRDIRVTMNPHRLPNSTKWQLRSSRSEMLRRNGKWNLVALWDGECTTSSYAAGGTDHVYIEARNDDEYRTLTANRKALNLSPQLVHLKIKEG